jgi:AmmeMemoRadiSam system protein A
MTARSANGEDASGTVAEAQTLDEDERVALLALARKAIDLFLTCGEYQKPVDARPAMNARRACFVTLRHGATGELRGCRGEVQARLPLVEAVARTALASALDDPRFQPVSADELPKLKIEISVLSPICPIRPEQVEVGRHGLLVECGCRAGLLLPQVASEWGWSREEFLDAVCHKAGLPVGAWKNPSARLHGFECEVFGEGRTSVPE